MKQKERLYKTIIQLCGERSGRAFKLSELLQYCDYEELRIGGNTPDATVRRLLRDLRIERRVTLNQKGIYTLPSMRQMRRLEQTFQRGLLYQTIMNLCDMQGRCKFSLSELIEFCDYKKIGIDEEENRHPRPKVRQLLQQLRDNEKMRFVDNKGNYELFDYPILQGEISDENIGQAEVTHSEKREYVMETSSRDRRWVRIAKEKFGSYCLYPECKNTFNTNVGNPYIEVHHIKPLFEGGQDELWNLSVVCAHHHRMAHFADNRTKIRFARFLRQETEKRL